MDKSNKKVMKVVSLQVVTQPRTERRKTIGGIDFEKMVATRAGE